MGTAPPETAPAPEPADRRAVERGAPPRPPDEPRRGPPRCPRRSERGPTPVSCRVFGKRRRACGQCGHRLFDVHTVHRLPLPRRPAARVRAPLLAPARGGESGEPPWRSSRAALPDDGIRPPARGPGGTVPAGNWPGGRRRRPHAATDVLPTARVIAMLVASPHVGSHQTARPRRHRRPGSLSRSPSAGKTAPRTTRPGSRRSTRPPSSAAFCSTSCPAASSASATTGSSPTRCAARSCPRSARCSVSRRRSRAPANPGKPCCSASRARTSPGVRAAGRAASSSSRCCRRYPRRAIPHAAPAAHEPMTPALTTLAQIASPRHHRRPSSASVSAPVRRAPSPSPDPSHVALRRLPEDRHPHLASRPHPLAPFSGSARPTNPHSNGRRAA